MKNVDLRSNYKYQTYDSCMQCAGLMSIQSWRNKILGVYNAYSQWSSFSLTIELPFDCDRSFTHFAEKYREEKCWHRREVQLVNDIWEENDSINVGWIVNVFLGRNITFILLWMVFWEKMLLLLFHHVFSCSFHTHYRI